MKKLLMFIIGLVLILNLDGAEQETVLKEESDVEFQERSTLIGHDSAINSVSWSPDGLQLASGSSDDTVRLWDPRSAKCLQILAGHRDYVWSVAWSPEGTQLASGSSDETIKLWDPRTAQCLQTLTGHTNWVNSVAWSPDGKQLASGSWDHKVKIWNPRSAKCIKTLHDAGAVNSVAWSPDGKQLASLSYKINIWDPYSAKWLQTLEALSVDSVAWSPEGTQLAFGSNEKFEAAVKIWDLRSAACITTLADHKDQIHSIAWSPDGNSLASGSNDKTIKLWDPHSAQCLQTLSGHTDLVISVAWSFDGNSLSSGSADNTIKIWERVRQTSVPLEESYITQIWKRLKQTAGLTSEESYITPPSAPSEPPEEFEHKDETEELRRALEDSQREIARLKLEQSRQEEAALQRASDQSQRAAEQAKLDEDEQRITPASAPPAHLDPDRGEGVPFRAEDNAASRFHFFLFIARQRLEKPTVVAGAETYLQEDALGQLDTVLESTQERELLDFKEMIQQQRDNYHENSTDYKVWNEILLKVVVMLQNKLAEG